MLLVSLIGVLLIAVASGFRNCDDCTNVNQCREASDQIHDDTSEDLYRKLLKAQCGDMKICCSDFSINARMAPDDEIENHPKANLLPDECGAPEGSRIIGGTKAKMNEYPWIALISFKLNGKKQFSCGGTVINERYVLTAAHCIKGKTIAGVRIGEYDIRTRNDCSGFGALRTCQSYLQDVRVEEATIHPNYTRIPLVVNDIGLLRLKKPLNLTVANAGAICLPLLRSLRQMNTVGEKATVAGWGLTENRTRSDVLLKVEVPILDEETCKSRYGGNRRKSNRFQSAFCAGEPNHDSCGGDSGGPLMLQARYNDDNYKYIQFGIVSYGPSQCGSEIPGVYTDVGKFMKWILDTMEP